MSELDNLAGGIVAVGVGSAVGAAVNPVMEPARQQAWKEITDKKQGNTSRVLPLGSLARLVAQAIVTLTDAEEQANRQGFNVNKLAAEVQLALTAPPVAETLELWRRGKINKAQAEHALHKAQIEPQYHEAILELFNERLAPAQIALGIIRSVLADPGFMPVQLNTSGGVVPRYAVSGIDPIDEAQASGIDQERLRVLVGEIGLPMSSQQAASAFFRSIIEKPDYYRAIIEGDTRPEWADPILDQSRQIISAHDAAELQLRGYLDRDHRLAKTEQWGMSAANSDLLYNLLGRSISVHQVLIGFRRGGVYDGPIDQIPEAYLRALQRGNLRPEYYNLAYAGRETYPSYFVTRALLQAGRITATRGGELFAGLGWPEDVAKAAGEVFAGSGGSTADPHVTKAQNHLWTTTHSSFVVGEIDAARARENLTALGATAAAQTEVIALWEQEAATTREQLTPAQIKKAYDKGAINNATGLAWTREDGIAALEPWGYTTEGADNYLNIP